MVVPNRGILATETRLHIRSPMADIGLAYLCKSKLSGLIIVSNTHACGSARAYYSVLPFHTTCICHEFDAICVPKTAIKL